MTVASPPGSGTVDIHLSSADAQSGVVPADQLHLLARVRRAVSHGYWLVGSDGGIFAFGSAQFHGSTGNLVLQRPVTGITPDGRPQRVLAGGDRRRCLRLRRRRLLRLHPRPRHRPGRLGRPHRSSMHRSSAWSPPPTAAATSWWRPTAASSPSATPSSRVRAPAAAAAPGSAVSVLPDATGHGYWLVTATGYVYTFGDAPDEGQPIDDTNGQPLPSPVTSAVRTPDGEGYWVLLEDGQALAFGDAQYYQSTNGESTPGLRGQPGHRHLRHRRQPRLLDRHGQRHGGRLRRRTRRRQHGRPPAERTDHRGHGLVGGGGRHRLDGGVVVVTGP